MIILELNSETDFVAKDSNFITLAQLANDLITKNDQECEAIISEKNNELYQN